MATARVTAHTTPVALFTSPTVAKAKITSFMVDNQSAALRTIRLTDTFRPDASVGTPFPPVRTIERLQVSVGAGLSLAIPESELRDIEILREGRIVADSIQAACVIVAGYHME